MTDLNEYIKCRNGIRLFLALLIYFLNMNCIICQVQDGDLSGMSGNWIKTNKSGSQYLLVRIDSSGTMNFSNSLINLERPLDVNIVSLTDDTLYSKRPIPHMVKKSRNVAMKDSTLTDFSVQVKRSLKYKNGEIFSTFYKLKGDSLYLETDSKTSIYCKFSDNKYEFDTLQYLIYGNYKIDLSLNSVKTHTSGEIVKDDSQNIFIGKLKKYYQGTYGSNVKIIYSGEVLNDSNDLLSLMKEVHNDKLGINLFIDEGVNISLVLSIIQILKEELKQRQIFIVIRYNDELIRFPINRENYKKVSGFYDLID